MKVRKEKAMKINWRVVLPTVLLLLLFSAALTRPVRGAGDAADVPGRYQAVTLPVYDHGKTGEPAAKSEVGGILDTSQGRFWIVTTCDRETNPRPCIGEISKAPAK
jgi:hypothetical protein